MCSKVKFSKRNAETKLNQYNNLGNFKNGYGRIYHCRECNFWHLTSKINNNPKFKFDDYKEMKENPKEIKIDLFFRKKWKTLLKKEI